MPELPDVEIIKSCLDRHALRRTITHVRAHNRKVLKTSPQKLGASLSGRKLTATRRHGKLLFARAGNGRWLVMHFGMTGFLKYYKEGEAPAPHERLTLELKGGGRLGFDNQRMFGEIDIAEDADAYLAGRDMGPDALTLDWPAFRERLAGRSGAIKSALMNQSILAGAGNVYSDEALFQAGIDPRRGVGEIDEKTLRKLHRTMRRVLEKAIEFEANPDAAPKSWLLARREEGAPCPRKGCGGALKKVTVSGRRGLICPQCQG